jgi:hypothetical protein
MKRKEPRRRTHEAHLLTIKVGARGVAASGKGDSRLNGPMSGHLTASLLWRHGI